MKIECNEKEAEMLDNLCEMLNKAGLCPCPESVCKNCVALVNMERDVVIIRESNDQSPYKGGTNMAFNKKYEVYDRGALLGQYYADEVSELIGIPLRRVSAYAASGARFLRRYTIEAVDDTEPGWAEEWDRVRLEKLAWLRGGGAVGAKQSG